MTAVSISSKLETLNVAACFSRRDSGGKNAMRTLPGYEENRNCILYFKKTKTGFQAIFDIWDFIKPLFGCPFCPSVEK